MYFTCVGADVIIIDEFAYIDVSLFFKTIVPILSLKLTSLLALSSPAGESNHFSTLMNLKKDNGESFFQVVDCFQICPKCMKLERVKAMMCSHVKSTAHWLSSKKIKELKVLYRANPEDAIREFGKKPKFLICAKNDSSLKLGGQVISDYKPAFRREEIDRCFKMPPFITQHPPAIVFTATDPSGGGPSQLAIVSGYFTKLGDVVIIGLDAEAVRDEKEEYLLLHRHYRKLNENKLWREAKKVFIPENNLGFEAAHLESMIADLKDVETFWEKPNKPGVCKDGKATRGYQFLLSNCLANAGLHFDRDLFTITREKTVQCMKDQLQDQMGRFHWECIKSADGKGKDRVKLTGKVGSQQDDLLITLAMIIYWGRIYMADKGY